MAPFSIKKGSNIYGLIFGTSHVKGIEKFLSRAWEVDSIRGEANFDIDGDKITPNRPSLFTEHNIPKKVHIFNRELRSGIIEKKYQTNIDVYLFTLDFGCLPKHAREEIKQMQKENLINARPLHISYDAWKNRKTQIERIEVV